MNTQRPFRRWSIPSALTLCASLSLLSAVHAKSSNWKDAQGVDFRGEPAEILGPFVIFRTGFDQGRRIPLRAFSNEDCVRIHAELAGQPTRAENLAQAKGKATSELADNVLRVENGSLKPVDLKDRPEPELLMVLAGSHNDGEGWFMSGNLNLFYYRLQRCYPGQVEGIFLGVRHDEAQHRTIASSTGMPWLVANLSDQVKLRTINRYLPAEGANAVLVSRQGVPLAGGRVGDMAGVRRFIDQTSEMIWQIDPTNAAFWPDRLHYLNATRPIDFAGSKTDPVLVGDPLRPEVLRKYGVKRVSARLEVAADGKITPSLLSGPTDVPAELAAPLLSAIASAAVAPAVDHGQFVAGVLNYQLEVPSADPVREAELSWFRAYAYPILPINDWLLLRPIQVSEQDFTSTVVGETAAGTVIMNPLEVNASRISRKAQMSAFNSDWFADAGADSVRPREGDRQKIDDGTMLTWKKVRSVDGYVDMQTRTPKDYTVGYAWAEFESPRDTRALLGLGSDDGVKIWLNGELVHSKWIRRPSRIDEDIVPLHLKKGANRILIKIQNATMDWSFIYRVRLTP